jgi:hypothetical protein
MVALPTLIPLSEAAHKYGLDEARLRELVEKGKIRAGRLPGSDEVLVSEDEVRGEAIQEKGLRKEDLPEYQKHAHWKGIGIGINEAAKEYRVPYVTVYQWMSSGIIRKIGRDGQKVLLDRADIAYCAEIYHQRGVKGRKLFNPDGTPYKPKKSYSLRK